MQEVLRRASLISLLAAIVLASSIAYSRITTETRYLEVRISYPITSENISIKTALERISNMSQMLGDLATNRSVEMGASLDEIVALIREAERETDETWDSLREEIWDQYLKIVEMVLRLNNAWVDPEEFESWWFEDPADSFSCAEFARAKNINNSEILDHGRMNIQLEANRTLSSVTYMVRWVTPTGEIVSERTHVLVREGSTWRFRHLDVQMENESERD